MFRLLWREKENMKLYNRKLVTLCINKYLHAKNHSQMYRSLLILRSYGVNVDTGLETYSSFLGSPDTNKLMNEGIDTVLSRKDYINEIFKERITRQVSTEVHRMIKISSINKKYRTTGEVDY